MPENPSPTQISDAHFAARDHDQGRVFNGPAPLNTHAARRLEPSNSSLPAGRAILNPGTQLANETVNPASHLSVVPSNVEAVVGSIDDAAQDGSYGTLMLGEGGRSKYLGPTAGSEWLRDVRMAAVDVMRKLNCFSLKTKMHRVRRLHSQRVHLVQR